MALTLVSTTATERLLRHVQSLSESEAEDALCLLVARRERIMSIDRVNRDRPDGSRMLRLGDGEHVDGQALDPHCRAGH